METAIKSIVSFDNFTVDPTRRVLLKDGEIVNLNPKAFDLLLALIERHGEVVGKDELLRAVWADQFVEENNLTVHIAALRKVFGEKKNDHRFIVTVPGSGYRFVAGLSAGPENEITIENHRFELVVIEEKIEAETNGNRNIFQNRRLNHAQKSKAVFSPPPAVLILLAGLGIGVIAAALGFWFWNSRKPPENKKLQFAKLTTSGKIGNAALTPDGKYAVFSQIEADGESLWLKHIASGSQTQILSNKPVKFVGLAVSPESDLIYATVYSGAMPDPQIWRIPLLGGAVEEIKGVEPSVAVSLSPDGKQFVFTESHSSQKETHLAIADSDGTNKRVLIKAADERRSFPIFNANPVAWSSDGREIAAAVTEKTGDGGDKSRILLVDPNDGSERFISGQGWDYVDNLVWVDAENLAFIAHTINFWRGQVWTISKKTGQARQLTGDLNNYIWLASAGKKLLTIQKTVTSNLRIADFDEKAKKLQARDIFSESGIIDYAAWTVDGRILYSSAASGKREIWRVNADGTNPAQLTVNAGLSFGFSVSPIDGSIAFCSTDENEKHSLRLVDSEGKNVRELTGGTEDVLPNFTADGQSIIFQRGLANKALTIWRLDLNGGEVTQLTRQHESHPAVSHNSDQTAYYFMDSESDNLWRIGVISSTTGEIIRKIDLPPKSTERQVHWHPGGRFLTQIYYSGENADLLLLPVDGGPRQQISGLGKQPVHWFEWSPDGKKIIVSQLEATQDVVLISDF